VYAIEALEKDDEKPFPVQEIKETSEPPLASVFKVNTDASLANRELRGFRAVICVHLSQVVAYVCIEVKGN